MKALLLLGITWLAFADQSEGGHGETRRKARSQTRPSCVAKKRSTYQLEENFG